MKFLVVDDSSVDRHLLVSLLKEMGHQVDDFNNAENILDLVRQENYAAVILDIVMPKQDGFKIIRKLRKSLNSHQQYIILYSCKKTPMEIKYGINKAGANDYIAKPVTKKVLQEVIEKV